MEQTDPFSAWKPKDLSVLTDAELEQYRDQCLRSSAATVKDRSGYAMAQRAGLADEFKRATQELNRRIAEITLYK